MGTYKIERLYGPSPEMSWGHLSKLRIASRKISPLPLKNDNLTIKWFPQDISGGIHQIPGNSIPRWFQWPFGWSNTGHKIEWNQIQIEWNQIQVTRLIIWTETRNGTPSGLSLLRERCVLFNTEVRISCLCCSSWAEQLCHWGNCTQSLILFTQLPLKNMVKT